MTKNKKFFKLLNVLKIGTLVATPFALALPPYSIQKNNDTSIIKNDNIINTHIDLSNNEINVRNTNQKSKISVKKIDDKKLDEKERDDLRNFIKLKPSEISTKNYSDNEYGNSGFQAPPGNIFKLLSFSSDVIGIESTEKDNRPRVTNMSNATEGLGFVYDQLDDYKPPTKDPKSPLPYFQEYYTKENGIDVKKHVDQLTLDRLGVLALRVDYKLNDGSQNKITEFLTITGFNSQLNKKYLANTILLDGKEYKKSIPEITNNDLISYPEFKSEVKPSSTTLVSRENIPSEGKLSYKLYYDFELPSIIKWSESNKGGNVMQNVDEGGGKFNLKNSYEQEFILSGFKKSPNMTTTSMIIIISVIIVCGVLIAALTYFASIFINKWRFRNAE